jgi:murein DD-endopeptidase MepM/ murein hydrolase activator NlpD
VDLAVPYGSKVYAAEGGKITRVGWSTLGGRIMVERGHSGKRYLFAHLSKSLARTGDTVRAGELIARVGSTGFATGPHLHFQISSNGTTINPVYFVRRYCQVN